VSFAQEFPAYFEDMACLESSGPQSADRLGNILDCAASQRVHQLIIGAIVRSEQDGSIATAMAPPRLIAITLRGFMHSIVQVAKR
jgi:hypothetical protein